MNSPVTRNAQGVQPATRRWGQLHGDALAWAVAERARSGAGLTVVVCGEPVAAESCAAAVRFFAGPQISVFGFPDWETLPYDLFAPLPEIVSERLRTLYRLPQAHGGVLVLPVATLLGRLPPTDFVAGNVLLFERGERLDIETLRRRLDAAGYVHVPQVAQHGEIAVRGAVIDLYPMGGDRPYRIDLDDDEVDSIRSFDPDTQRTIERVERIELLPGREFPLDEAGIAQFRSQYRRRVEGDPNRSRIYRDISDGRVPGGIEYYLPLFFPQTATLFDYLPADARIVLAEDALKTASAFLEQVTLRHAERGVDPERPILAPADLYLNESTLAEHLARLDAVETQPMKLPDSTAPLRNFPTGALPELHFHARADDPAAAFRAFAGRPGLRVLVTADGPGRRELLADTLRDLGFAPGTTADWQEFQAGTAQLAVGIAPLEHGLWLPDDGLAVVPEAKLLGIRPAQRRRVRTERDPDQIVRNLTELHDGAPVVHELHGVGRYAGLTHLDVGGIPGEFVVIEYAGNDRLYVPVAALGLLSRYAGTTPESAPLHKLGGQQWSKARAKAAQRVRDIAAELLDLHARRAARKGHAFPEPSGDYAAFAAAFPFEETPDQQRAIDEVLGDLVRGQPTDRVVCGDVGFGKTEVAMRAAYVAATAGRQVAVLAPTTLLAQQHFQNFSDRFADTAVRVELLSRLRSKSQQQAALDALAAGGVDIVIGTHRLLQPDVRFKRLGLVIIDEEHRFGVRHKERFKQLRAEVDLLTLTATPIPRTLNMAMAGLRDLSIIATPPPNRHAIKTFVTEWDDALIRDAIARELKRGGQVYVLHNEIRTIDQVAEDIRRIVPQARVEVGHGQMAERELERVMVDFYHQRFNVLVCTTIIESGIDVPSANTIIMDRADKLGLAQLHQLRGRVGRSHHRAYAYLLVPSLRGLSGDARKRLEAIESTEDLGAGFMLATHDMEIRGAGELLGDEQSGQIQEIGFALYSELLERAVADLKAGREPALDGPLDRGPEVEAHVPALFPDDYLPDVHQRLVLYKRIANAEDDDALRALEIEVVDRFGPLPPAAKNLFAIATLKRFAASLRVRRLEATASGARIQFHPDHSFDPAHILTLAMHNPGRYKIDPGDDSLRITEAMPEEGTARIAKLREHLRSIAPEAR